MAACLPKIIISDCDFYSLPDLEMKVPSGQRTKILLEVGSHPFSVFSYKIVETFTCW